MQLLFNADDFGISPGVNQGIIEAFHHGVVRSTTLMTNLGPTTLEAIALAQNTPGLDIGIHLNMFLGPSLTGFIQGCTDESGLFFKWIHGPNDLLPPIDLAALKTELQAQIQFAFDSGLKPTHLDSHRHGHVHPALLPFVCELAEQYQLKLRNYDTPETFQYLTVTENFNADFYDANVSIDTLKKIITQTDSNSIEFMCHPAYVDEILLQRSSYTVQREKELQILTSPELLSWLQENNHELIHF
ncbi:MAG: chitin disaccharide deacetylase [Culicoidibacterales bacterium]